MPQASSELTERWDGPSEEKAVAHLLDRGYRLARWDWLVPIGQEISDDDKSAALFMVQEWDYGWFIFHKEDPRHE
jgi:hypothetical protein